jgi:hypothetical protein
VASIAVLVPILVATSVMRWHVNADGIGGRDKWYVYRWVEWSDVVSVSPRPIPGYRLVWINARGRRRAFWVPLFLTDMTGFRQAVTELAPPDNPLRRYLEDAA